MPISVRERLRLGELSRRWHGMSRRRRVLAVLLVLLGLVGVDRAYFWLTEWRPRLVFGRGSMNWVLAISPDSRTLVSRDSGNLTLWDTKSGERRATWSQPAAGRVYQAVFTPDGKTLVAYSFDGTKLSVELIDAGTGRVRASIPTRYGGALGLKVLDQGRTVRAVVCDLAAPDVVDCDVATGQVIASRAVNSPLHTSALALSEDGKLLAGVMRGVNALPDVVLWDLDRDREAARLIAPAGAHFPRALAFSHDGKTLAVIRVGPIELWDLASCRIWAVVRAHHWMFVPMELRFSPDDSKLGSLARMEPGRYPWSPRSVRALVNMARTGGKWEGPFELLLLDLRNGRQLGGFDWEGREAFSPDGRFVATTHYDGSVRIRDIPGVR